MSVTVQFSPPPSANKLWRPAISGGGYPKLVKTRNYHSWIVAAACEIKAGALGQIGPIYDDVAVSIKVPRRSKLSDLDNRIKPCLDAIQHAGVLKNDKQVVRILAQWSAPETERVVVEIHSLGVTS
jgi:Holliday junction resolvase RusA-like endonuclease